MTIDGPHRPASHDDCPAYFRAQLAQLGLDASLSHVPPVMPGPYTPHPIVCGHGHRLWLTPPTREATA